MIRLRAELGSLVFLVLAPGVVAGLIPWWITDWQFEDPTSHWGPIRVVGAMLVAVGLIILLDAFRRFAIEGVGTPAPVAPTAKLVVGGLYRYLRNPMYVAVATIIVGQALLFGQLSLLAYAAAFVVTVAAFVHWYEEPTLRRQFGAEYDEYRQAVPGWWPRRRAWKPGGGVSTTTPPSF